MNTRRQQRGFLLITVVVTLFLLATVAMLLTQDSAISANTSSAELETARADYVAQAGMQHALWRTANNACMGDFTIPLTSLGPDSYSATVTGASAGTGYILNADQDAWIRSDDTDKNNNNAHNHVRYESGNVEQVLTRFDLSALPANAQINSAVAWFHLKANKDHPEGPISVHEITADWGETTVTWDSFGGAYRKGPIGAIPVQDSGDVWVAVNLSGTVQAWVNGQPNNGILFNSEAEGLHTEYTSREDGANPPRLEVIVGSGPASPIEIQVTGSLENGVERTLTRPQTVALQPPAIYNFRPGPAASSDAEIWDQAPNNNYGDATETWVSSASNDTTRSLLRFDFGEIPAGARILDAELVLHRQSGSGSDQPISAHRIINPWSEDSVTWNDRESGTNWDTAGGDYDQVPLATTLVGPANQAYSWDITALVQQWIDGGQPNYGVALVAAIGGLAGEEFYTSDHATLTNRPSLSVTYACECANHCMAPRGSGSVLLVRNRNNPTSIDVENQARLEHWGYTVNVIDDWDSQSDFNSAFNTNDVVFVSGASPFAVGSKLSNAPIGIVNSRGELNDELGIAPGYASPVGPQIDSIDNSHYVTAVFPTGDLEIFDESMQGLTVSGSLPAGALELGNWGSNGAMVILDQGSAQSGGGTASSRRALLPVGSTTPVDWRYVNGNGQLLVQRAIAWGMRDDVGSTGTVLMVVGNDNNLTGQEIAKQALLESWGYAVNVIDEDDNQGTFDTALAANDVVFVGEDVNDADLSNKLVNATIGVVTEEMNQANNLGFSAAIDWDSGTSINIANNSHYITQPFNTGNLTVLTANESLAYADGTSAPDITILGTVAGEPGVATLAAGATIVGGGTAAGRRALLPWGGNDMDINHLNSNGLTIFRRALEWGTGAGCGNSVPLLLVVGDDGNPSSDDAARQSLLQSWCYAVTLIDASASQADFDAAALDNDVIYLSEELDGSQLLTKVRNLPIGIVSEERLQWSHLGFASGLGSSASLAKVNITDDTHQITYGLALGEIAVVSTEQPLHNLQGTLSPDLRTIGEHPSSGYPSLAVLDIGDTIWTGGSRVPARRVFLPWGGDAFQFDQLNEDGQTIMRQAIEWAMSGGPGNDDAEQLTSDGTMYIDSTDLELADNLAATAQATDIVGIRFPFVSVPPGETITSAYIQFQVDELDSGAASLTIEGEAVDNARSFDTAPYNITARPRTSAAVPWNPPVWTTVGARGIDQRTPNLSAIVQEIVDRPGWAENNAMVFIISGPGTRTAEAYEGDPAGKPELFVQYGSGGGGGGGISYVEKYNLFTIANSDTWQPVDLSIPGVPANAVAEIAIVNSRTGNERWGGVRARGSSLDRRFRLHEAEGGGVDAVVMHVQTDANGHIEAYSDNTSEVTFRLLGYWTGATYVELFDNFSAGGSNSWRSHDFGNEGVGANEVAEVVVVNKSTSRERLAGVRPSGSSMERRLNIHEAESGGVDTVSMMVNTDASARAEVYTSSDSDIDFYVVGYWSTPPGAYTEIGGSHSQMTSAGSWQQWDLAGFGVPADAVVQVVVANEGDTAEQEMGIRATGSGLNRLLDVQEAESGGSDNASMHAVVDANRRIQAYSESGANDRYFHPVGWWVLN